MYSGFLTDVRTSGTSDDADLTSDEEGLGEERDLDIEMPGFNEEAAVEDSLFGPDVRAVLLSPPAACA